MRRRFCLSTIILSVYMAVVHPSRVLSLNILCIIPGTLGKYYREENASLSSKISLVLSHGQRFRLAFLLTV